MRGWRWQILVALSKVAIFGMKLAVVSLFWVTQQLAQRRYRN
jgi:hypothetical protein